MTPGVRRDPDAEALVVQASALGLPPITEQGVAGARAYLEQRAAASPPGPDVESVTDESVPADHPVPVRVYRPAGLADPPLVVYLHGGGWVVGSVATSDAFSRRLAVAAAAVVVSVDYRLAPEHPFPAAVDDAEAAVRWAVGNAARWGADADRLVVVGDSAGGNIAAVVVRRLSGAGGVRIARQVLAYPVTRADRDALPDDAAGWPLTEADMRWFVDQYVADPAMRTHPDVSPLHAGVDGLPSTTLLVAGCDPLAGEGLDYARRLSEAGVPVDLHYYPGQIHGFLTFDETILPRGREALAVVAAAIANARRSLSEECS